MNREKRAQRPDQSARSRGESMETVTKDELETAAPVQRKRRAYDPGVELRRCNQTWPQRLSRFVA
jgi:hypothetical protein